MLTQETIQQARTLDLPSYLKASGLDLIPTNGGGAYKALCPFHADKSPSLSLTLKQDGWLWHCFGCNAGGDAIEFVKKREGLGFREAVTRLSAETLRLPTPLPPQRIKEEVPLPERKRLLTLLSEHYHQNLLNEIKRIPKNQELPGYLYGPHYLEKRGLFDLDLIREFKIGYSDGESAQALKEERVGLRKLDVFTESYYENWNRCLSFPILDEQAQVTDLYGRRTWNKGISHLYNGGDHVGLWNWKNVAEAEEVILTESILDALSIYKAGFKNVTALYGASGYRSAHDALLKDKKRVIFALDNDKPGRAAVRTLKEQLTKPELAVVLFPSEHKDANGVLTSQGVEALQALVSKPLPLEKVLSLWKKEESQTPEPSVTQDAVPTHPSAPVQEKSIGPDLIHQGEGLRFEVRGALALRNLSFLKLVVRVHKEDKNHTDRLDFYSARSRKAFTAALCEKFEAQENAIENDLQKITETIERHYKNKDAPKAQASAPSLTEQEAKEALAFLKSKDLIRRIIEDIGALGYVGDDTKKLLLYLSATSRKLRKPISLLIRSQSSTGKSFLIEQVCTMMPAEDIIQLTGVTPKALYYMEPDALKHKFLAIDERAGMEDAEYSIRSLQSSGKLTLAVPSKNPLTGKIETSTIEREGPIAYVDGSTDTRVNPENANRCFEVYLDESPEQTARIQEEQKKAHTLEGLKSKPLRDAIRRKHQSAQRLLKPVHVVLPYAHLVQFPADWIRTRRDHDRFLNLIVSVAFLHQHQREHKEHDGKAYIEATALDYTLAYKLAADVLWNTFAELDKSAADFYAQLESLVEQGCKAEKITREEYVFTRRQARTFSKLPPHVVKNLMRSLTELEYLDVKKSPQGSKYFYSLAELRSEKGELLGLTKPEELKAKLAVAATNDEGAKK